MGECLIPRDDNSAAESKRGGYTFWVAASIVVANMVGTGVFTSLGYQLLDIQSAPVILLLWIVGGVLALCGALCYAELGSALPRSGGEYNFLTELYHPGLGFIAGWVSATIGFAAPTALAAITAGVYLEAVFDSVPATFTASLLVLLLGAVHLGSRRRGGALQLAFTVAKVALILSLVIAALVAVPEVQDIRWAPVSADLTLVGTAGFAVALIFVNYAYTGWNAATYLVGEIQGGAQRLPGILLLGTALVIFLYVLLHVMFLLVAPMDAMAGKIEIGYVAGQYAFGSQGSGIVALLLSILLVSTVSAMLIAGPRALQVIGQDFKALGWLARENRYDVPYVAILFQTGVTLVLVLTGSFDAILVFAGFLLGANTLLAVAGVFLLRRSRQELPFRMPLYPLPVLIYLGIMLWTLSYVAFTRVEEALFALAVVVSGGIFYFITRRLPERN